jgi:hypothetical protein
MTPRTNEDIKAGIMRQAELESRRSIRKPAPATEQIADDGISTVDAASVGAMLMLERRAGADQARAELEASARAVESQRVEQAMVQNAYETVTSYVRPLVEVVGHLVTSGVDPSGLLSALTADPEHMVEAAQLAEALEEQWQAQAWQDEEAIQALEWQAATSAAAIEEQARQVEDARFLARNPEANIGLLQAAQERAGFQGQDLSLDEASDRVRVAAAADVAHGIRQGILDEEHRTSVGRQLRHEAPPVADPARSFANAARVAPLNEGESIKARLLSRELGDAQAELDAVRASGKQQAADIEQTRRDLAAKHRF